MACARNHVLRVCIPAASHEVVATLVKPADEPSRGGLPDERTLAWRPQPLTCDQFSRAPEWPLAFSAFREPERAIEELRRAMPAWNPPSAQGYHNATLRWQYPPVWADPMNPGYMCSIPPAARLITWTLGQRDFQMSGISTQIGGHHLPIWPISLISPCSLGQSRWLPWVLWYHRRGGGGCARGVMQSICWVIDDRC